MKIKQALAVACASALLPLTAAACGDAYDREEFIDSMVSEQGVTREQATCITDKAEAEIGLDRLNTRGGEATDEEVAIMTDAAFACLLGEG